MLTFGDDIGRAGDGDSRNGKRDSCEAKDDGLCLTNPGIPPFPLFVVFDNTVINELGKNISCLLFNEIQTVTMQQTNQKQKANLNSKICAMCCERS